jgi:hypothetical protein
MFCTRQLKWRLWRAGAGSERQPWEAPSRVGQRGLMFPGRITDARARSYWQALSMGMLPKLGGSNLVRTDFADSAAWEQASNEAHQENADGFRAYIEPVSDPAFDGLSWEAVKAAVPADDDEGRCSSSPTPPPSPRMSTRSSSSIFWITAAVPLHSVAAVGR